MGNAVDLQQLAATLASAYDDTGKVAAVVLAGSVGRGRADSYSDVELDVYWSEPPRREDRRAAIATAGGTVTAFWDFAPEEGEWAEEFTVDGHRIGVSGFEAAWTDRLITNVIDGPDPQPLWQMRLAAIRDGVTLVDHGVLDGWRERIDRYPPELAQAVISYYLDPARLGSWHQRFALLARDDRVRLRGLTTSIPVIILGALCGLNRVFVEHQDFKWAAATIEGLAIAPDDLRNRLWQACDQNLAAAVSTLDRLLVETLDLIDQHATAGLTAPIRQELVAADIGSSGSAADY